MQVVIEKVNRVSFNILISEFRISFEIRDSKI
jgi:hypothetical protein